MDIVKNSSMDLWESIKARLEESIAVDKFLSNLKDIDLRRVEAFNALSGEREYQESLHKKTGQDPISVPGELALLKVYLDKAFAIYAETFGDPGEKPTMDIIRKITAIGLRALENYGCPLRDIKGSLAARPPEQRAKLYAPGTPGVPRMCQRITPHGFVEKKIAEPIPPSTEDISEADVTRNMGM